MTGDPLWVWVVYDHPSDFPDAYVARAQRMREDGSMEFQTEGPAFSSPDLEDIRGYMIAQGLTRLERFEEDDPVILETWI